MQTREVSVKEEEEEWMVRQQSNGSFWSSFWCHLLFSEFFQLSIMLKCEKKCETSKTAFF